MKRRSFLSTVGALFSALWLFGRSPAVAKTEATVELKPAEFDPLTAQFLMVGGATLTIGYHCMPSTGPMIRVIKGAHHAAIPTHDQEGCVLIKGHCIFEKIPDVSQMPGDPYPHASQFPILCDVWIGTIDELTAKFRSGLQLAVHTVYCQPHGMSDFARHQLESQQPNYQALRQAHREKHPWDEVASFGVYTEQSKNSVIDAYEQRLKELSPES